MNGGPALVVDEAAGCIRAGTENVVLDMDLTYWCEWTNDGDEDPRGEPSCNTSAQFYVRVGTDTCYTISPSCTDYAPLVDDDPVHNASSDSQRFCGQIEMLPPCGD